MHAVEDSGEPGHPTRRYRVAQDLLRDWRRWTKAERIAAGALLAIIFIGTSVFIIAALAGQPI